MSRPRLPLTEFERKRLENSRTVAVAALVAGIAAAAILAYLGYVRVAAIAVAVPLVHGLVVLCSPLRRFWLTVLSYGLIPVVAGFVLGFPLFGVLTGVFFVVFLVLGQLRVVRGLGWDTLRILEPTAMEPAAGPYVAAFEALGFERVGAYGHDPAPDRMTIVTVLLGPKRDQYACVTDLVLDVTSVFGSRLLITRNSASTQLPPEYLSSDLRGAEPDELVDAHRRALEVLRMRG